MLVYWRGQGVAPGVALERGEVGRGLELLGVGEAVGQEVVVGGDALGAAHELARALGVAVAVPVAVAEDDAVGAGAVAGGGVRAVQEDAVEVHVGRFEAAVEDLAAHALAAGAVVGLDEVGARVLARPGPCRSPGARPAVDPHHVVLGGEAAELVAVDPELEDVAAREPEWRRGRRRPRRPGGCAPCPPAPTRTPWRARGISAGPGLACASQSRSSGFEPVGGVVGLDPLDEVEGGARPARAPGACGRCGR